MKYAIFAFSMLAGLGACGGGGGGNGTGGNGAGDMSSAGSAPSFANAVRPILTKGGCLGHHMTAAWDGVNTATADADIVGYLTSHQAKECNGSVLFVKPGDSANSYVYQKISADFAASCGSMTGARMPLGGMLTDADIATVKAWIDDGASAD